MSQPETVSLPSAPPGPSGDGGSAMSREDLPSATEVGNRLYR